jgi:glycosyltransferase involved in cell wall biosynthesis
MRVSFVLPGYFPMPIGGYRVVYEYADYLAARGHAVTIVFPKHPAACRNSALLGAVKMYLWSLKTRVRNRPLVPWHSLHPGIKLALVPTVQDRFIPDGDITVATGWRTARPVADLSQTKGAKFYLIQHHETWDGPEEEVNATWRLPLYKIVISRWLLELGGRLGATELRHIPNGIDTRRFHIITPPEARRMSILSLYHRETFKGLPDALAVLRNYHQRYPDVPVTMFGAQPRGADVPDWIQYFANPNQDALVRDIYNQHTVYFGASLAEGWALPPAEGMACGCAFVGTDIGGFRDYAIHDDTALLSPPGDRDGLLRNLIMITEDTALRSRIQRRGTENVQRFTWAAAGSALENYFQEHVQARPAGDRAIGWMRLPETDEASVD